MQLGAVPLDEQGKIRRGSQTSVTWKRAEPPQIFFTNRPIFSLPDRPTRPHCASLVAARCGLGAGSTAQGAPSFSTLPLWSPCLPLIARWSGLSFSNPDPRRRSGPITTGHWT